MNVDFTKLIPDKSAVILAIISAVGGWGVHAFNMFNSDQAKLDEHTASIQQLQKGQRETHETLNSIQVTLAHVDGQIGVVNQKIDDDRAANAKRGR